MRTAFSGAGLAALISLTVVPGRWSLVKAQSLASLPTCAQPAILAAVQASGCQIMDKKCFCSNPALIPSLTSSLREACSASDQAAVAAFASTYCGTDVGAGLMSSSPTLPAPASAASSTTAMPPNTSSVSVSVSLSSSTITSTANMTMNSTMTMMSTSGTPGTSGSTMSMSTSSSSIDWPTGVTAGGAAVETGMAMAALAVAAGAMGLVLGEL